MVWFWISFSHLWGSTREQFYVEVFKFGVLNIWPEIKISLKVRPFLPAPHNFQHEPPQILKFQIYLMIQDFQFQFQFTINLHFELYTMKIRIFKRIIQNIYVYYRWYILKNINLYFGWYILKYKIKNSFWII